MASSFLCPPDSYSSTDRTMTDCVQRLHSRLGVTDENESREVDRYTKPRQVFGQSGSPSGSTMEFSYSDPMVEVRPRQVPDLASLADIATTRTAVKRPLPTPETPPIIKPKTRVSASRRERCRINQARYRTRQRQHAEGLDTSIRTLQEEIQELEAQRQCMLRRSLMNKSVWVVVTEYFRLFRNGYADPATPSDSSTSKFMKKSHEQLDFLKRCMAADVTDSGLCGAEALLEKWKILSHYCGDVNVQLERLEQVGETSLLAKMITRITVTESMLRQVFPHLVVDHERDEDEVEQPVCKLSPLGQKLLDQRLTMRGSVRFDWDETSGQVVRLETNIDMLTPILRLLSSLVDVAAVFEKAVVTPECRFRAKQ
ncbi:unnamed protein product [Phytophthora lilii]|uniref:Unnamed protein product n=1 Tax=Phytophthora lilii TaxID=2077276 RepID=A0A9W6TQW6_9STRA|nr:unnamed protein product [Phytophthora lilii]